MKHPAQTTRGVFHARGLLDAGVRLAPTRAGELDIASGTDFSDTVTSDWVIRTTPFWAGRETVGPHDVADFSL